MLTNNIDQLFSCIVIITVSMMESTR